YSPPRAAFAKELLEKGTTVLRANAAEHALLSVPADVVSIRTGEADTVSLDHNTLSICNGHALMAKVTGTGCLSGAVAAAFLAVTADRFAASASAMLAMGVAAEMAAEHARGPGT